MKKGVLALIMGIAVSTSALADRSDIETDMLYGPSFGYSQGTPSPFVAADIRAMGRQNNQSQEDDVLYGYRNDGIASKSEPYVVIPLQKNQQQEDDYIYGYRN